MFKKLRLKFVLTNMIMVSAVVVCAFVCIYLVMFYNVRKQNFLKLDKIQTSIVQLNEMQNENEVAQVIYSLDDAYKEFGVITDSSNNCIFETSMGIISQSFISDAVVKAVESGNTSGEININGKNFLYSIQPAFVMYAAEDTNLLQEYNKIAFLDISSSKEEMNMMLLIFIAAGTASVFMFFIISIYLSKKAVAPIEKSYIKQKQFIQDASHELKTPITSIMANLDVINSNGEQTVESQKKWIKCIYDESGRMSKLVNDMLVLAKTEHVTAGAEKDRISLSDIVSDSIISSEAVIFEKGIKAVWDVDDNINILGDKYSLEHLISILLDNAVKYTPEHGYINIRLYKEKRSAVFKIVNSGPGIPKDDMEYIFDRFYKADKSRKNDGSFGLGLCIAKTIVANMDGKITVSGEENKETVFTVKFNII